VTVDIAIVDTEGQLWMTGPRATLGVKVQDDPGAKQGGTSSVLTLPGSSRQQQQSMMGFIHSNSGGAPNSSMGVPVVARF